MDNTPVIMLEVQIHAREWVTSAGTFYMVDWVSQSVSQSF